MRYTTVAESRAAGVTYHLVPAEVWSDQKDSTKYIPEGFDREGFIHCTNGLQELIEVANRYYAGDTRAFRVLVLEMDQIASPVRYDDPQEIYPHIYGPLNTSAVVDVLDARRDEQGTFISFSGSSGSSSAKGSKS